MNNYIVMYHEGAGLLEDYPEVQGKTAIESARKFINDKTKTIKRSASNYVNLCLLQGTYDKKHNTIKYVGNKIWYEVY